MSREEKERLDNISVEIWRYKAKKLFTKRKFSDIIVL